MTSLQRGGARDAPDLESLIREENEPLRQFQVSFGFRCGPGTVMPRRLEKR